MSAEISGTLSERHQEGTYDILILWWLQAHVCGMSGQYLLRDWVIAAVIPILDVLLRELVLNGHLMSGTRIRR